VIIVLDVAGSVVFKSSRLLTAIQWVGAKLVLASVVERPNFRRLRLLNGVELIRQLVLLVVENLWLYWLLQIWGYQPRSSKSFANFSESHR